MEKVKRYTQCPKNFVGGYAKREKIPAFWIDIDVIEGEIR